MKTHIETPRLLIREVEFSDVDDFYEMDSDPEVHKYLDQNPVKSKDEMLKVIEMIRQQYKENGIARWAVVDKISGEMLGWCGIKFFREPINDHVNIYEFGYRFKQKHWGKGIATESSLAILDWGFKNLDTDTMYAITHPQNEVSMHVLKKMGFELKGHFYFDYINHEDCTWFELKKEDWKNLHQTV